MVGKNTGNNLTIVGVQLSSKISLSSYHNIPSQNHPENKGFNVPCQEQNPNPQSLDYPEERMYGQAGPCFSHFCKIKCHHLELKIQGE